MIENKGWRFDERELKYIKEVLDSGFAAATAGSMCQRFEKRFAEKVGAKYGVCFNSGTSTMHSCLAAAGVGPGDEVIVPAFGVIMTANVVLHQNAVPVFADVSEDTFNIDPKDVERKITSRTKAIIPVSLYGLPADFDPLMELAGKHNLAVIEDDAQAVLATYKGRTTGSIGHMASFSFENSKHLTTGDGGMVTASDEQLARKVRKHGSQGFCTIGAGEGRIKLDKDIFQDPDFKRHDMFAWNYRMPEVAAAVGLAQLEKAEFFVGLRQKIAAMYADAIKGCGWLIPQYVPEGYTNAYWTYAARFEGQQIGIPWKEFRKKYIEFGGDGIYAAWSVVYLETVYQTGNFYGKGCPVHCPLYKGKVRYEKGLCPTAEAIQPKVMQFVNNYSSTQEAEPKVEALRKTIKHFGG
ncbi:MAG: DegT/DnrJ/EryC1/StrS family aminotransferase [Chloroflexi bacterium]|nr:DegT/DnrJ/EryC1/StrS family aminotransferase [Chloroflexota bacterium]